MNSSKHEGPGGREDDAIDYIDQDESDLSSLEQAALETHEIVVPSISDGLRLDRVLADAFPERSRTHLQKWITDGQIQLDRRPALKPDISARPCGDWMLNL